jgi:hypothetical protein
MQYISSLLILPLSQNENIVWIKFWKYITNIELSILVIWSLIVFFLLLFVIFFFSLIISRFFKIYRNKKQEQLIIEFQEPIANYLFELEEPDVSNKILITELFGKKNLNKKFNRNLLRKELISLHRSYTGEFAEKLEKLFTLLGFEKDVLKKLKTRKWHIKARGLNEANEMNLKQFLPLVLSNINHKKSTIRIEAQVAHINLNRENPFAFFGKLVYPLSDLDHIRLHDVLMLYNRADVPLMGQWVNSPNIDIQIFALKMIGYYSQESEFELVIKSLDHQNTKVKIEAIRSLGKIASDQSLTVLSKLLENKNNSEEILLEILTALKDVGIQNETIGTCVQFLFLHNYDVCFTATRVIKSAPNGSELLGKIIASADESISKVMRYALSFKN